MRPAPGVRLARRADRARGAKFAPLAFAPVMEQYVVPHACRRARGHEAHAWATQMATEVKFPARPGDGVGHDRPLAEVRGRGGREGRAALRARHRQGDAGGRGGLRRHAAEDRRSPRASQPVGTTIAFIGEQGEESPRRAPEAEPEAAEAAKAPRAPRSRAPEPAPAARDQPAAASRAKRPRQGEPARPADRARARHRPRTVRGTGPEGRIVAEDVERAAAQAPACRPAPAPSGEVERSRSRRPAHDRAPADRGVDGARLPADRLGDMTRANALVAGQREPTPTSG